MKKLYSNWLIIPLLLAASYLSRPVEHTFPRADRVVLAEAEMAPMVIDVVIVSEVFNGSNLNVSFATTGLADLGPGLDISTVNNDNVKLFVDATNTEVTGVTVNSTGGADAISLTANNLDYNTAYRIEISDGVQDADGNAFDAFQKVLTTSPDPGNIPSDIEFDQVTVVSNGQFTSLEVGPDGKLYGLLNNGNIKRWDINPDGTLTNEETINTIQTAEGGARLAIGFTFDPAATASNLVAWVSHTTFGFGGMDDWDGKVSQLSGPDLGTIQDYLVNLPRSTKDHVTNGLDFGPDGRLYFNQGSNSAMGAPDNTWGLRPERLLTAAVLAFDPVDITNPPLNVQTEEGGTYDPFAVDAPLKLFATGVRNPYDLVWHSNGNLYVPTNGSAAGGNTPATPANLNDVPTRIDGAYTGGSVPPINGVNQTQNDFLFRCVEGGYYGHPNPTRGEYVMNGGNPTSASDPGQVNQYPVGTLPDPNYRGFAYNFENNKSPNGVIEYQSNTFGGALKNKLLVVRYSGGDDIIVLTPGGSNNDIVDSETGISGFTGFSNPLDLCENPANGHIYVSEYGGSDITLLRPVGSASAPVLALDSDELIFSGFVNPPGSLPNDVQTVAITNNGVDDLEITNLDFSGTNAAEFSLQSPPTLPLTIGSGQTEILSVAFDPAQTGNREASLEISSNDLNNAVFSLPLYGLSSAQFEGSNEPPMADIVATLGYGIDVGWSGLTSSLTNFPLGEEVLEPLFQKAGPGPVVMTPVARYSPPFLLPFGYYVDNDNTSAPTLMQAGVLASGQGGTSNPDPEHQTLFPELNSGTGSFDPGAATFGFFTTSPSHTAYTEDALNALLEPTKAEHAVRVYPMKDRSGNLIPNSYLLGFEEASNGDYNDYVFVVSNITPASQAPPPGADVVRINVGGGTYTAQNGDVFNPDDASLITGDTEVSSKTDPVSGTDDDDLYLEYRFGENFTYNVPVANGTYTVKLYFAEIFQQSSGARVFDIDVEGGQGTTTGLDLFDEAGFFAAAMREYSDVSVSDGNMTMAFTATQNNAILAGIEIIGTDAGSDTPPTVTITGPVDEAVFTDGATVTLTGEANDAEDGPLDDDISWSSDLDGFLGTGASLMLSDLSAGTHVITASVEDADLNQTDDQITLTIAPAAVGNELYRETFWNDDANNDLAITARGWQVIGPGGSAPNAAQLSASKGLGKPANLQNINAGDLDPTPADGRGFAAGFAGENEYFFWTEEYAIDLSTTTIEAFSWYQGHNNANAGSRVAVRINGQWYVSQTSFSGPGLGSASLFPNDDPGGAQFKEFVFTTNGTEWAPLDITDMSEGTVLSTPLPTGIMDGFGLYLQNGSGFTARFDNFQITGENTGVEPNNPPVVDNPIPDQEAIEGAGFSYTVPANTFSDADQEALSISAVESGQATLPGWLSFDDQSQSFSGTPAPTDVGTYTIAVTATDPNNASVTDEFDLVVLADADNCGPISPALCGTIPIAIDQDFCLNWEADEGGLADGAGVGTGFTMVSAPSDNLDPATPSNPLVPGYEPSRLSVANDLLTINASKGIFFKVAGNNGNSQVNALGVGFDAAAPGEPYEITTKIVDIPTTGANNFHQAGIWFGLDEANYVKLVALASNGSVYRIQLSYEANDDVLSANERNSANVLSPGEDVVLKLIVDPINQQVTAQYSLDDGSTFEPVENTTPIDLDPEFFSGTALPDNSQNVTYAGVHATIRNANAANSLDYQFDYFCIDVPEQDPVAADLELTVSQQGHPTDQSGSYEIRLYPEGETQTPAYTFTETAGANGVINLTGLDAGNYQVWVKHPQSISSVVATTLNGGSNTLSVGPLRMGDILEDNEIEFFDFTTFASVFGLDVGDTGYEPLANLNEESLINLLDFTIFADNYNKVGDAPTANPVSPLETEEDPDLQEVGLNLEVAEGDWLVGDRIPVDLFLRAGDQAYDGVQVQLAFDPSQFALEDLELNQALDITLQNEVDRENGLVKLAMGTLGEALNGDLRVARLYFRAVVAGQHQLALIPEGTLTTFSGHGLPVQLLDADLEIGSLLTNVNGLEATRARMTLFPNPGNGYINILLEGLDYFEQADLEIMDLHGRLIRRIAVEGPGQMTFDVQDQPDGIYLIQLVNKEQKIIQRYSKQ